VTPERDTEDSMMQNRLALIAAARAMAEYGLNQGTSGNLSLRAPEGILITPSAIPYAELTPEMLPLMQLDGAYGAYEGDYRPSSEWRFHLDIYAARPEVGGIVHHHAPYSTALSMARREIPACHYMIARFGGAPVRCAPYALFGTAELSAHVLHALEGRSACLMANHGGLATGKTIGAALAAATELELLAQQYLLSLSAGGPVLLSDAQVQEAITQFAQVYGPNTGKTG
jgi:L-fuculose-phosphate aldolase